MDLPQDARIFMNSDDRNFRTPLLPTMDIVFQYIFGSEGSENGLLGFLNTIQMSVGRPLAKSVVIRNPFNRQDALEDKLSVLDLKVTDSNGQIYDVEMQTLNKNAFDKRILYYWSRLYAEQLQKSEDYWLLRPVTSIILSRFEIFSQHEDIHSVHEIRDIRHPEVGFLKDLQFHFLELTPRKWNHFVDEIQDKSELPDYIVQLRNWVDFFQNVDKKTETEMSTMIQKTPGLDTAYDKYEQFNQSDRLRDLAEQRLKTERDRRAELAYMLDTERAEGWEKGRAEGRVAGIAEGRVAGIAEGRVAGIAEGRAAGIAEGRAAGIAEGRAEGIAEGILLQMRKIFLQTFCFRYDGEIPEAVAQKMNAISDVEELQQLNFALMTTQDVEQFMRDFLK